MPDAQDSPSSSSEPTTAGPLVSVVVPCYRVAEYLPDAVASVVAQTLSDWELLIVDDGSPDSTGDVVRELIRRYPGHSIRCLTQANSGVAAARNRGIAAARGRYVLPLDADDALEPRMLEVCVALLESDPEIGIAFTDLVFFGARQGVVRLPEFDAARLAHENTLRSCALFRREIWKRVGGYDPEIRQGYEDWDFWIACVGIGVTARRIPEPLFRQRIRPGSQFPAARERDLAHRARIVESHPELYSERARTLAALLLEHGEAPDAELADLEILLRAGLIRRLDEEQRLWQEARERAERELERLHAEIAALRAEIE